MPDDQVALRLASWLAQLAGLLQVLHGQGYVHRDLKPANIMSGAGSTLHILDFGMTVQHSKPFPNSLGGTRWYQPPEIHVNGINWTPAVSEDWWVQAGALHICTSGAMIPSQHDGPDCAPR